MTLLPAVQKSATLREALEVMRETRLYHILVLDGDEVTGILSVVDALRALVEKLEAAGDVERVGALRSFFEERVERVSTRPVIVVEEGVSLRDAARIMHHHRIGCLPVIRGERVVSAICEPVIAEALAREGRRDPVYHHATRRVVYVEAESPLMEALGVMAEGGFRRLPVTERGVLSGLLTAPLAMTRLLEDPALLYREVREAAAEPPVLDPWVSVSEAAGVVAGNGLGAVVLVEAGSLAGIFTERDAVRVYASPATLIHSGGTRGTM